MKQTLQTYLAVVACLLASCFATTFAAAQASARITQHIDENMSVKLAGNTRPEANAQNDRGRVSDAFDLDHMFLLLQRSPEQEQELNQYIESLNDRNSPNFHQWLTPEQLGDRYGVAQDDIDKVTNWLESHGFRINHVYPNKVLIDVSATAGGLREAFHTEIHQLDVDGVMHFSNMSDPRIPAALAPVVKGFFSLNDFKPHPTYKPVPPEYTFAGCTNSSGLTPTEPGTCYAITPQDNQTIYNLNPLYTAGYSGQGQTIVLVEDTDTYGGAGDWNTYRTSFGLSTAFPLGTYTQVHPGGCTDPGTNGDDGEAAIDVEVATAIAPSAAIELISCPSVGFTFGGIIALQNMINAAGPYPGIVSVSYGVCESANGAGGNAGFNNTYQQAAAQGISVFVSSGDGGPSGCSDFFGTAYDVTSLGVTGWGESPYNVSVGGTDFEDVYNAKFGGPALSTYWNATNTSGFGSAKSYVPEMPWDDSCANGLISEFVSGSFVTYGTAGFCNISPGNSTSGYESPGAGAGGPSNCATGGGGTTQTSAFVSDPQCQGYAKPSWQSGSSLTGGKAVYGVPNDGVRDIPDVSMFAANGVWGHFETVCWSDPTQTSGGAASCSGAPSTWSGFGGTSVATPTMAAIQALVNQKTGETWGNPNPIYYQIAQNQYGVAGGTFLGSGCNSSTGNAAGCAFNDVTQGDISVGCENDGTTAESHCYKPSGTFGVDSTDNVTAATVIVGGSGYTTAPTCAIAGPSNAAPYKPNGVTQVWAGGTQATCTAAVNAGTNTAKWTVKFNTTNGSPAGDQIIVGSQTYTLAGASANAIASALNTAINANNTVATSTVATSTVTITAKVAGAAGNFLVATGPGTIEQTFAITITNSVLGEGPNYVSGITINTPGSGYGPETPITLTGVGTGAVAVANSNPGTTAQSYQPAYGAAPGYDLATGLGTPNAYNLVCSSAWGSSCVQGQTITFTTNAPGSAAYGSSFNVAATASSGLTVAFTASGACSVVDNNNGTAAYTMTNSSGTCSVIANQAGNGSFTAAPTVTETTNAATAASGTTIQASPTTASQVDTVTLTATVTAAGNGVAPTGTVTFFNGANSLGSCALGSTCSGGPGKREKSGIVKPGVVGIGVAVVLKNVKAAVVGPNAPSATATLTVTNLPLGMDSITATYGGDGNYNGSTSSGTTVNVIQPGLYAPTPSSTLTSNTATFQWTGFPNATAYWIDIGAEQGSHEYYSSGSLSTSTYSATVNSLPTNGSTVYVTLYDQVNGSWVTNYYTYTAFGSSTTAMITSPTPSTMLSGSSVVFTWSTAAGAAGYWLDAGSSAGGHQYYSSGNLGSATSTTVNGLPTDGSTVNITLYTLQNGNWLSNAYTYTAYSLSAAAGVMTTPMPGSTLTGSSVTFGWTAGSGASAYWIDVGSTTGAHDIYSSGNIGNVTSYTVNGLPTDGSMVYVTLYSLIGSSWSGNTYTYTALNATSGLAAITSPTPSTTLSGNQVTFMWSSDSSATGYWLDIGTAPNGNTIYSSGNLGTAQMTTVSSLPADGTTIYVTLYSLVGGQWLNNSYMYVSGP